jgi:hypothetical protein
VIGNESQLFIYNFASHGYRLQQFFEIYSVFVKITPISIVIVMILSSGGDKQCINAQPYQRHATDTCCISLSLQTVHITICHTAPQKPA